MEETGATFVENAKLKAEGYARLSGLLTLADDSGLEVLALGGEPGVYSARYAGEDATDAERYNLLLSRLQHVPPEHRHAQFRCAIAVAEPGGSASVVEAKVEGYIALAPKGTGGFGYDPIFYLPENDCTMAELPEAEKNKISHRARAARAARDYLLRGYAEAESDKPGGAG